MSLAAIRNAARPHHLIPLGALHANESDGLGDGTIILLGPLEPGFWPHVSTEPEFLDQAPDPMDRWSARVIGALAADLNATALFPFGTPARPFISWALRSGEAFLSPASMLVHGNAGLLVSYRGALFLPEHLVLPEAEPSPCETCATKPCLTACPPKAIIDAGYDLPACHAFLDTPPGDTCLSRGCAVRRSCPLSARYPRMEAQSAFHMRAFHN